MTPVKVCTTVTEIWVTERANLISVETLAVSHIS